MSFGPAPEPQMQSPNTIPTQQAAVPVKSNSSKGMVIAFLALLPVVGAVIYFMMPDLFTPLTGSKTPVQQENQLPIDSTEIDEGDENTEEDEQDDSEHGSAEEDDKENEEENEEEEKEDDESVS